MSHRFAEIAFTPNVRLMQERHGSRAQYRAAAEGGGNDTLGPQEAAFLARADSFICRRSAKPAGPTCSIAGPAGFLRVLSPTRIAFADFRGNVQYVSAGNALHDDRVAIIVMDYANRRRLKLLGHLMFVAVPDADPDLVRQVELPGYRARVERVALIDVVAFDWNCPQHITVRFTEAQVAAATQPLRDRIAELEARLAAMPA